MRHRPPRLQRLHQDVRPFYFVTFNTWKRERFLANNDLHAAFVQFCQHAQDRGVAVGRYVIMPDHAHLFVVMPPSGTTLAAWVKALRSVLGKTLTERGTPAPHWQEGFFDHVMRSADSYSEKWEYVRMNPVRAHLVAAPEDWPFQGEICSIRF